MKHNFIGKIPKENFEIKDGDIIPLKDADGTWIGSGILSVKEDGIHIYGRLDDTEAGKKAMERLIHGFFNKVSIAHNAVLGNIATEVVPPVHVTMIADDKIIPD